MIYSIDVSDKWGRKLIAEVVIRLDTVEVRCRDAIVGIADREMLRGWLRAPGGVYAYDEMAWMAAGNGVALVIDDVVPPWVLADHVLQGLRECV